MQPGLIWGCARTDEGTRLIEECDDAAEASFRWLHLNLADQRTLRWLERSVELLGSILTVEAVSAVELIEVGGADAGEVLTPLVAAVGETIRETEPLDARVRSALRLLVSTSAAS